MTTGSSSSDMALEALQWRAQEFAAVSGDLSPDQLWASVSAAVPQEQREVLLSALAPHFAISTAHDQLRWRLLTERRVEVLTRIQREGRIAKCVEEAPAVTDDFGHWLRRVLSHGAAFDLARLGEEELMSLASVLQELSGLDLPKPNLRQLSDHIEERRFRADAAVLLEHGFVGRNAELAKLQTLLDSKSTTWLGVVVTGLGGAGKSTLLAHFTQTLMSREHAEATVVTLDFDRPGIDPRDDYWLEMEIARQVGYQQPTVAQALREARAVARQHRNRTLAQVQISTAEFKEQDSARKLLFEVSSALASVSMAERPLLLVLDTFENVTQRQLDRRLVNWLFEVASRLAPVPLRVVFSGRLFEGGRAFAPSLAEEVIELSELEPPLARDLLTRLGVKPEIAHQLSSSTALPRRPLELRLLALLAAKSTLADIMALESELRSGGARAKGLFAGLVYRRVLSRLGSEGDIVHKLACPGLVLRYMTVELVREVLVPCLDLPPMSEADAQDAFDRLAQFEWLVERRGNPGEIWHRKDLRRSMLKATIAEEREIARKIHVCAASYFIHRATPDSQVEATYHLLMGIVQPDDAISISLDGLVQVSGALLPSIEDLPPPAAALLRFAAGETLVVEDILLLPSSARATAYSASGTDGVRTRAFGAALAIYDRVHFDDELVGANWRWQREALFASARWASIPAPLPGQADVPNRIEALVDVVFPAALLASPGLSPKVAAEVDAALSAITPSFQAPKDDRALTSLARLAFGLVLHRRQYPLSDAARAGLRVIHGHAERMMTADPGGSGAERVALLGVLALTPRAVHRVILRTPIPLDPQRWNAVMSSYGQALALASPKALTLSLQIGSVAEPARGPQSARGILASANAIAGAVLTWGHLVDADAGLDLAAPSPKGEQLDLLEGPYTELRDPTRFALLEAFVSRDDIEQLREIFVRVLPVPLDGLADDSFVNEVFADAEYALESYVEYADRAGKLEALLLACVEIRPDAQKLRLVYEAQQRWRAALFFACKEASTEMLSDDENQPSNEVQSPLPIGALLDGGRFEITRAAGEGGFGITYEAYDRSVGRTVALKEYFPKGGSVRRVGLELVFDRLGEGLASPGVVAATEMLLADRVDHPAVAKTFWAFTENRTAYIAMEWVDGQTLNQAKLAKRLTPQILLKVYLTVFDAALHFEKAGIAHRDLNPNNIMLRSNGEPVVIDFGLARAVGPGYTLLSRTAAFVEGLEPPEQRDRHGNQGVWTDIYTLSASIFYVLTEERINDARYYRLRDLALRDDSRVRGYKRAFLDCIDRGLIEDIGQRLQSGDEVVRALGLGYDELKRTLAPAVFAQTLLKVPLPPPPPPPPPPQPSVTEQDASPVVEQIAVARVPPVRASKPARRVPRYQRCLLQSFDTARFQPTSVKRADGGPLLQAPPETKVALARTEAALNILFGREIVVPAGQIAESPAFKTIFSEMMQSFAIYRDRIDALCKIEGCPRYRPMRIALENESMGDYVGFVEAYKFTGAPLVLLGHAGQPQDNQKAQEQRVKGFQSLFLAEKYDALEQAVRQPGYGEFARSVRAYFGPETAVFADTRIPEVSANDYRQVFTKRLSDEALGGVGVVEARGKLPLVEEIEVKLRESHATGFRGNWYLFANQFDEVWPLARAYLDLRLFLTLGRQYGVDHPILISQEFEYGRFDHSLWLGPKVSSGLSEAKDGFMLDLASQFASPIDWNAIFALFLEPKFLRSIYRMNSFYFSNEVTGAQHHVDLIVAHGDLVDGHLGRMFRFEVRGDRLCVDAVEGAGATTVRTAAFDSAGVSEVARERDEAAAQSFLRTYGGTQKRVSLGSLVSGSYEAGSGADAARAVLHYLAKPYNLLIGELV